MQDFIDFLFRHTTLSSATFILIIILIVIEWLRAKRNHFTVTPTQAVSLINHENAVVLDVRPADIFAKAHIIGAISISAKEIQEAHKKLEKYKTKPFILVCRNGMESQKLAVYLKKQGKQAYILGGGMRSWIDAAMPVIKE